MHLGFESDMTPVTDLSPDPLGTILVAGPEIQQSEVVAHIQ